MLSEVGIVSKIEAEGIWVRSQRQSACGACQARAGCGQRLLHSFTGTSIDVFATYPQAEAIAELTVGDRVEIEVAESAIVSGSLLLYIVPLTLFIASLVVLESVLAMNTAFAWMIAILLAACALKVIRDYVNSPAVAAVYQPRLVRKLAPIAQNQFPE